MDITFEKIRTFNNSNLYEVLKTKDKNKIIHFLDEWGLYIENKKIKPKPEYRNIWKDAYQYWDKKQLVKKINLNSAFLLEPLISNNY